MRPEKRMFESNRYDEASSESDGDSSSRDDFAMNARQEQPKDDDSSDFSEEEDHDSIGDSSDASSKDDEDNNRDDDREKDSDDGDSSSGNSSADDEDDNASDEDMPLYERIRRKEEHGINLRDKRQQKSEALQLASQRLASFVEKKRRAAAMNDDDNEQAHSEAPRRKKKKSKHRPTEVSSKRADYFRRGAPKLNESGIGVEVGAKRYKPLDPRASSLSGHFNEEQFQKNYAFLEEMRNQEIGQVRKRIAAYKATGERGRRMRRQLGLDGGNPNGLEEEQARLKALTQQRAEVERRKIERVAQQNVKRKIKEGVESGKHGAFFLKRTEKKRLEYEEKIKEIRKRKGSKAVEKVLAKKRKRDKSRDAKTFAKYD